MPSIASRTRPAPILNTDPGENQIGSPLTGRPSLPVAAPLISTTLRSPLPNLVVTSQDSLRQYYAGGQIPQYRFPPLKPIS